MELVLLEYIETKEYGKIAHFLKNKEDVYSKVIEDDIGNIIYEELQKEIQDNIKSIYKTENE